MKVSKGKLIFSVVLAFALSLAFTTLQTTMTENNIVSAKSATYSIGSKGSGVKSLQSKLKSKGYKLAVDGIYGSGTRKQVMNFQRDNGLAVDGVAGKQTHAALNKSSSSTNKKPSTSISTKVYKVGSRGSGVKTLQQQLKDKGYNLAVDGIFGQGTKRQVMNFQRDNGLSVDGIAGKQTHAALSKSTTKPSKPTTKTKNVVDKMTKLGNSQQVILVTTKGMNNNKGQVRTFEKDGKGNWNQKLSATAYVGKNGLAHNKREGDLRSPTGKYSIGHAFGYNGNPGTKLPFKASTSNDVWVDDSNSKFYNTWQKKNNKNKDWNSAEEMTHELYKYGFTINYNTAKTPSKGSAIFMHVARAGTGYTTGCTATSQGNLLKVMNWIDPAKDPVIIQDVESNLGKY